MPLDMRPFAVINPDGERWTNLGVRTTIFGRDTALWKALQCACGYTGLRFRAEPHNRVDRVLVRDQLKLWVSTDITYPLGGGNDVDAMEKLLERTGWSIVELGSMVEDDAELEETLA